MPQGPRRHERVGNIRSFGCNYSPHEAGAVRLARRQRPEALTGPGNLASAIVTTAMALTSIENSGNCSGSKGKKHGDFHLVSGRQDDERIFFARFDERISIGQPRVVLLNVDEQARKTR